MNYELRGMNAAGRKASNLEKSRASGAGDHSDYHRAQVAAAVRDSSGIPAFTDYVAYIRQLGK